MVTTNINQQLESDEEIFDVAVSSVMTSTKAIVIIAEIFAVTHLLKINPTTIHNRITNTLLDSNKFVRSVMKAYKRDGLEGVLEDTLVLQIGVSILEKMLNTFRKQLEEKRKASSL